MQQAKVLSQFLDRFSALYPQLSFRGMRRLSDRTYGPYHLALRITPGRSGIELDLLCMALTEGYPQEVARAVRRVQRARAAHPQERAIVAVIAPYLEAEARDLCRSVGVAYLDLAGNAGIDVPQLYLEINGENTNPVVRKHEIQAPLEGKAERVARALLLEPERRWTLRALVARTGVSLGMTSMVTSALAELGVISKDRRGVSLYDPGGLLDRWAQTYELRRSPFRVFRTRLAIAELARRWPEPSDQVGAALTLWSGAQRLLDDPPGNQRLALYWSGKLEDLAQAWQLGEQEGRTQVFVFQPYDESVLWGLRKLKGGLDSVHPVQLYLDLASGDQEELALAQRVRERLLAWL